MKIWKIIFLCLLPYSHLFSQNDNVALLVRILDIVFSSGRVSFVHDKTAISHVFEKALMLSNITLNSFAVNYFTTTKLRSVISVELQQAGTDTLIVVRDADDFLVPLFQSDFRKKIRDLFQSHSRMVFAYERASVRSKKLLKKLANEFAIDIFIVENLVLGEKGHFEKVEPVERISLRVKRLDRAKIILFVNKNGTTVVDWADFELKEWSPKFASGTFFRFSMFHCPPFWYVKNGTWERGIESLILDEIMKGWPVKYYIEVEKKDPNEDKWNLAVDLVQQRERDAAGCSQWVIRTVDHRVTLSYPMYQTCATFLVKKPQLLPVFTFLLQSLQVSVYTVFFPVLLLVWVLLELMKKLSQWSNSTSRGHDRDPANLPLELGRKSFNTLVLFWSVFYLLSSTYYSAGLTTISAYPRVTQDIRTLKEMTDSQVPYYHIENNYAHHFRTFGNPTVAALAKLYRKGHKILNRTENSAIYVKSLGEIEYVSEIEELPLSEWKHYKLLEDCVGKYYAIFVLQENSPYTRVFSKVTQRLVEGGLVSKMFDDLFTDEMNEFFYFYDGGVQFKLINLERMQGALLLLAVGWITSLVIFVFECLYSRRVQKKLGYLH